MMDWNEKVQNYVWLLDMGFSRFKLHGNITTDMVKCPLCQCIVYENAAKDHWFEVHEVSAKKTGNAEAVRQAGKQRKDPFFVYCQRCKDNDIENPNVFAIAGTETWGSQVGDFLCYMHFSYAERM